MRGQHCRIRLREAKNGTGELGKPRSTSCAPVSLLRGVMKVAEDGSPSLQVLDSCGKVTGELVSKH